MATAIQPDAPSGPKNTSATAAGKNDSPAFPHPTYTKLKARWEKCRALMGETEEIRAGREKYLTEFEAEGTASFEFRLKLVAVSNFFKRAVQASVGMLLESEPVFGQDMPQKVVDFAENVDLRGKHISVYARRLAADYVIDGFCGTLVDYPPVANPEKIDSDLEARLGLRPFFVRYTRADILKIVEGKVNGVTTRILVVLRETLERLDGDSGFGVAEVTQYRVFRLSSEGVTWAIWESNSSDTEVTRKSGPSPLFIGGKRAMRIPFIPLGDFDGLPPLENLADLNIEHHNTKTNLRNLEFLAMVPTQVRIGAEYELDSAGNKVYPPIELGPRSTIEAPHMEGVDKPVYWHSPDVSVLEPGRRSLEDIKSDMGVAALSFLTPDKRAAETAAAKRIDSVAERANISSIGRDLQDHLEDCFGVMSEMVKLEGGSITLPMEFEDSTLSAQEMAAYTAAYIAGGISLETFLDAWKRGKRIDENLDIAAEVRRIISGGKSEDDAE